MTTKEQISNAKEQVSNASEKYYEARRSYIKTAKDAVREYMGFYLKDDNSDEDGQPVRIHTSNLDYNYEYFPSFDQVDTQDESFCGEERIVFIFHVVDGDGLFPDNTWVSEDDFADESWEELLDYIAWDD